MDEVSRTRRDSWAPRARFHTAHPYASTRMIQHSVAIIGSPSSASLHATTRSRNHHQSSHARTPWYCRPARPAAVRPLRPDQSRPVAEFAHPRDAIFQHRNRLRARGDAPPEHPEIVCKVEDREHDGGGDVDQHVLFPKHQACRERRPRTLAEVADGPATGTSPECRMRERFRTRVNVTSRAGRAHASSRP